MLSARNKTTNEVIKATAIYYNASYLNPKDDEWLALDDEILNLDELIKSGKIKDIKDITVRYRSEGRKPYKKRDGYFRIRPCFYFPEKERIGILTRPQDIIHNRLLNWLFQYIQSKDASFDMVYSTYYVEKNKKKNKININQLPINVIDYETRLEVTNGKKVRADVFVKFHKRDILFGEGIVFEIQLTKQKDETKEERTLDRAIDGFSVCWLGIDNFDKEEDELVFSDKIIELEPFAEILKKFQKNNFNKWRDVTQQNSRIITDKINEHTKTMNEKIKELNHLFESKELSLEIQKKQVQDILDQNKKILQEINSESFDILKKKQIDFLKTMEKEDIYEFIKEEMINKIKGELSDYYSEAIERKIEYQQQYLEQWKREANDKIRESYAIQKVINEVCPRCNSPLSYHPEGKFGPFIGCTNWESGCKFILSLNKLRLEDD